MAGLNDLELETLDEVNLSPPLAPRPPPAVPARRARRIVSGVALGVTLVLALITWVSLRVDTPPIRGGGGASWWRRRLLRRLAEATY